jgi:TusA-related sulfurtransferase
MRDIRPNAPISADDRVSDVLARDEALVDVFVRHAPHFARLRSRALRRVMARLVTVAQAARTAHVPVEHLLYDLNTALGIDGVTAAVPEQEPANAPALRRPRDARQIEVDVRDEHRYGREPFTRIMRAVAALGADEVLQLRTIFEPVPLLEVLAKRGFAHESEAYEPGNWSVWFWRPASSGDLLLDVRGLAPPEPMLRTLAALDTLPTGATLVHVNNRVPQLLFPILAERGFVCEVDESEPERVVVRIRHAAAPDRLSPSH